MTKAKKDTRWGRLTVVEVLPLKNKEKRSCMCICDCGKQIKILANNLVSGTTKSCGCLRIETVKKRSATHKSSKTKLYRIWGDMKRRCSAKKCQRYKNYGGRGISVCQEWKDSFENFQNWAINSGYKEGLSIERVDVNANYCPENCTWIPYENQSRNKTNTRFSVEDIKNIRNRLKNGEKQVDLAKEYGTYQANISAIKLKKAWKNV